VGASNGVTAAAEQTARDRQDSNRDEFADRREASQATENTVAATHRYRKTSRRQAPKPTLAEPVLVAKFHANRRGDIVVIALRQIEDGPPILDIRKFFTDENGIMRPTKKGVSVDCDHPRAGPVRRRNQSRDARAAARSAQIGVRP
jgi:hypothetical protein